jgi:hypothetical protein
MGLYYTTHVERSRFDLTTHPALQAMNHERERIRHVLEENKG